MELRMRTPKIPGFVGIFDPLARRLLRMGVPLGPNALLTVAGRRSGEPRTTPVALIEIGGRRWLCGTFGETNWVRNLRAAGRATLTVGNRREEVTATELDRAETATFFADVLGPYVRSLRIGPWLLALLGAREILTDPQGAAALRPVFELRGR
ncbi:MAG TPA: nitroreductase family deazaflavin-dependent oxidoreductase [Candidatus Dormibacteraeota bacterium]